MRQVQDALPFYSYQYEASAEAIRQVSDAGTA